MTPPLVQLFDQILNGDDIPTPAGMLRVKAENAAKLHPGAPYSLLTNLAHTVFWQDIWLAKLRGEPKKVGMAEWSADFRVPDVSEWEGLRARFLDGLKEARQIAAADPMDHQMESDEAATNALLNIAVHGAYHCGQMNLLKRLKS